MSQKSIAYVTKIYCFCDINLLANAIDSPTNSRTDKEFRTGNHFSPEQFEHLGSSESARQALSRICREEMIIRLSKGVYLFPIVDKVLGVMYPSVDKVARAISGRDKSRIIPTGISALNSLELSTQILLKISCLADVVPRKSILVVRPSPLSRRLRKTLLSEANGCHW